VELEQSVPLADGVMVTVTVTDPEGEDDEDRESVPDVEAVDDTLPVAET
jgi:hypothetical protein